VPAARTHVGLACLLVACSSGSTAPSTDAGSGLDADRSPGDGSTGVDGSPSDGSAGVDGAPDGGTDDGSPGCHPINVSGFQPPDYPPAGSVSRACDGFNADGGLVTSYGDACLGINATYGSCAAFTVASFASGDSGAAFACYDCLVTSENPEGGVYGAVVQGTIPVVNYSQCIEVADPDAGDPCAQSLYSAAACAEYACKSSCPVTDESSQQAFVQCTNEALSGACVGYAFPAETCELSEQGDGGTLVATECFAGSTAEDHYLSIAHYLCGGN